MIVTTHDRAFDVDTTSPDPLATWQRVKEGGEPLTAEQFEALPTEAQEWIESAVTLYFGRAAGGGSSADADAS